MWWNHQAGGSPWLLTVLLGHSMHYRGLTIKFKTELKVGFVSCGHCIGRRRALSVDASAPKTVLFGFGSQFVSCRFFGFFSFFLRFFSFVKRNSWHEFRVVSRIYWGYLIHLVWCWCIAVIPYFFSYSLPMLIPLPTPPPSFFQSMWLDLWESSNSLMIVWHLQTPNWARSLLGLFTGWKLMHVSVLPPIVS